MPTEGCRALNARADAEATRALASSRAEVERHAREHASTQKQIEATKSWHDLLVEQT